MKNLGRYVMLSLCSVKYRCVLVLLLIIEMGIFGGVLVCGVCSG